MTHSVKIRCNKNPWYDTVELAIISVDHNGKASNAKPCVFEPLENGMIVNPCITVRTSEAQQLMDELWNCGLRPSEGSGSAGSLKATENHLSDMKKIAFMAVEKIITQNS